MPDDTNALMFEVFNEIGIIEQLGRTLLEARLPDGLIGPHFAVISHLMRVRDGQTPIDMARAFQVPKTSMTHTVKGLEAKGYVEVRANPDDGRSKQVWLTARGRQLRADTIEGLAPDFAELAAGVDVARLAQILPVLSELRVFLDQQRNGRDG